MQPRDEEQELSVRLWSARDDRSSIVASPRRGMATREMAIPEAISMTIITKSAAFNAALMRARGVALAKRRAAAVRIHRQEASTCT